MQQWYFVRVVCLLLTNYSRIHWNISILNEIQHFCNQTYLLTKIDYQ